MFGIGWTEMLVLGVVALIVIGPKDLPVVMNRMGKILGSIRRMGSEFQRELNKASGLDQVADLRKSITAPLKQTADEIRSEFNKTSASGKVEPSGVIKPKTPGEESVVETIHDQLGIYPPKFKPDPKPTAATPSAASESLSAAVKKASAEAEARSAAAASAAPAEAAAKKPRAPRKPRATAAAASGTAEAAPKPRAPRKPKSAESKSAAPKPEAEA